MSAEETLDAEVLEEEDTQEGKYLTWALGDEEYGIEIRNVTEIIGIQKITDLPDVPQYVKGVINLRGKVIPVLDVRLRFGLPEREYDKRTCIVVVNIKDTSVGLIVDQVSEVLDIPAGDIELPSKVDQGAASRYIQGLGKVDEEVKNLLDIRRLLFEDELEESAELACG